MEDELEGIELETVNPEVDSIVLPGLEDLETEDEALEIEETETEDDDTENEKELLKKSLNKERRSRKEAEKKAKSLEARILALEEANKTPEKSIVDELVGNGVDESIAKSIAQAIDKKSNTDAATKQELAEMKFKISLTEKSKEEGFEDILDYADEIKELVDKGLTLEQSYYATTYNRTPKTANTKSEIERKLEAKMQNNKARKEILGNNISSNSGVANNSSKKIIATAAEKAIAAAAGMTVEDYVAMRDMNSVKDYNSYKNKKK